MDDKGKDIKESLKAAKAGDKVEVAEVTVVEATVVDAPKHSSTDTFLLTKRAEDLASGQGPELLDRESTIERIAALDAEFAAALKMNQNDYLTEANEVLKEMMVAIRERVKSGDEKLKDIVQALDILSNKYNNFLGLPTNVQGHLHKHQVETISKKPSEFTEEELDAQISETRDFLNYKELGEVANSQ